MLSSITMARLNEPWRSNILQEGDATFDTFDTLEFARVEDYLKVLKTIEPVVHGLVIAGRRAHATPGLSLIHI